MRVNCLTSTKAGRGLREAPLKSCPLFELGKEVLPHVGTRGLSGATSKRVGDKPRALARTPSQIKGRAGGCCRLHRPAVKKTVPRATLLEKRVHSRDDRIIGLDLLRHGHVWAHLGAHTREGMNIQDAVLETEGGVTGDIGDKMLSRLVRNPSPSL